MFLRVSSLLLASSSIILTPSPTKKIQPKPLVSLNTDEGESRLIECITSSKYIQPHLLSSSTKQKTNYTCGIASVVMLFNARLRSMQHSTNVHEYEILCHLSKQLPSSFGKSFASIFEDGISMEELACILLFFNCEVKINSTAVRCDKNKNGKKEILIENAINVFRNDIKRVLQCKNSVKGMIINFLVSAVGYESDVGHHSPIAAYHEKSDSVLLYDCWMANDVSWVDVRDLYLAMCTMDNDAEQYRGYLIVENICVDQFCKNCK